ncbi:hypothetical protein AXF42_Ash014087 [Apostasia shenzhenica]|uniref:LysM domain-containing protein n=1 Tax=Apostasia shenzhenica TaxID=1088818 RepID=A0A2I0A9D5_9ASPA|nr:hypothetical protein AXF42_Ash014087 [Apostasia shenzhenica]
MSRICPDALLNGKVSNSREENGCATIPVSSSSSYSIPSSSSPSGVNYILHRVSKMDTLAGVAIKYGVEVSDIRRMNSLVTDLQMFAHKSLRVPLPGRHPPSSVMSNGSMKNGEKTPPLRPKDDILDSFQSLKQKCKPRIASPAMINLQGYYGLTPPKKSPLPEGTEMAVYKSGRSLLLEDEAPVSSSIHTQHWKVQNSATGFSLENGDVSQDTTESERSIRRRQKVEADPLLNASEILIKEESISGPFPGRAGKGLALRPKPGSRTDLDAGRQNSTSGCDFLMEDSFSLVRKSSSTSNLSESDSSSSTWPTSKWPIFDGLPKPITSRRNKAALD